MGALINVSINLDKLDKSKIIKGKKGNYYKLTLSVQDQTSAYGDNASIFDTQSKEERDAKANRNYVGKLLPEADPEGIRGGPRRSRAEDGRARSRARGRPLRRPDGTLRPQPASRRVRIRAPRR